jgi:8-oxo-dGTP pyrophosphatase MutT (NUDIX family)
MSIALLAEALALRRPSLHHAASKRASVAVILRVTGLPASAFPAAGSGAEAFLASSAAQAPAAHIEALFIKRTARTGDPWSGHVAFPGGKRDAADASDRAAAEREVAEEVGLDLLQGPFLCLGRLDDRPVYTGGRALKDMCLCVFVWVHTEPQPLQQQQQASAPAVQLQAAEVASARWVRVDSLQRSALDASAIPVLTTRSVPWLASLLPSWAKAALGLEHMDLPAVRLAGMDAVSGQVVASGGTPEFQLWGMTLQASSDLLSAWGQPRLMWPPVRFRNSAVQALLLAVCGGVEAWEALRGYRPWSHARHGAHLAGGLAVGAGLIGGLLSMGLR